MVGTVKGNRAGLPQKPQRKKGDPKNPKELNMVRGESRTKSAMYLGEKLYYTEWMDRKNLVQVLQHAILTFKGI